MPLMQSKKKKLGYLGVSERAVLLLQKGCLHILWTRFIWRHYITTSKKI